MNDKKTALNKSFGATTAEILKSMIINTYAITYTNDSLRQRKFAQIKADSRQTARTLFIDQTTKPGKPVKILSCRKITNILEQNKRTPA